MVKRRLKDKSDYPATASTTRKGRGRLKRLDFDADVQTSYFFMLNCLLHSRVQTGLESNTERYDEDVNVYLAHLLNSHIDPKYFLSTADLIGRDDSDVFRMIEQCETDRQRYRVYRVNADYLLMAVAVFDIFEERHCHHRSVFHIPKTVYIARAAAYYGLAASYATKLGRGTTGISETLAKISDGIESYVRILMYMRGQYLRFIKRYSDGELFHLERSIEDIRKAEVIEDRRNKFLDVYHAWMNTRDDHLKERLFETARLLREVDPSFDFQLP
ncbi:MAG: hypothetical protein GF400_05975 [Candidatus Eisenbacteria bacterium]|nr:hypothetical protein [Candidatus Eisenbacteria bacterium]